MHVVVIGAGAIGSALALGLARDGRDAMLVARGGRLTWLRDHPVELERDGEILRAPVAVTDWCGLSRPAHMAFLCTKTGDFGDALKEIALRLADGAIVVTLQNGVEAHDQAAAALPRANIVAGRVHGFFEMSGHLVRHVGVAPSVVIGGDHESAAQAAAVLTAAGFPAEVSPDIVSALWEKLMLTAGLGAVGAAMDVAAGQVCAAPGGEALLRRTLEEIARVAAACGAHLDGMVVERTLQFIRRFPVDATTSLQRDLAAGRCSEYDSLVGAVIRLAALHRIAVPTFSRLDLALNPLTQKSPEKWPTDSNC